MTERVVYLLGAGFSAPLGLPVVRNFLFRAKDLYAQNPDERLHFKEVFDEIRKLAEIKNYFEADLFNIEEIFSILDMRAQFDGNELAASFRRFICDVIRASTPALSLEHTTGGPLANGAWGPYFAFVATLLRQGFCTIRGSTSKFQRVHVTDNAALYDVISLNYDIVLETAARELGDRLKETAGCQPCHFVRPSLHHAHDGPVLAKLHGCVSDGDIVPPTWRKGVSGLLAREWAAARDVLGRANQVRIIGYSLPTTDAYVRYLLKASLSAAPNLKRIDVLTLHRADHERYREFITFKETRYAEGDVAEYFRTIRAYQGKENRLNEGNVHWYQVEEHHEAAIKQFLY